MRVSVLLGILLAVGSAAHEAAQSGDVRCPMPGAQLTFSDGSHFEAVSDRGNYVCRFKNLNTYKTYDRLFGSFLPTSPVVAANAEKIRSLAPFQVGRKTTFENSGASVRGTDGFWIHEVSIERFEKVTTAAGTFSAFVILWDERTFARNGRWQSRYWYSPDVNHTVKFEYRALRGNPPPDYPKNWELTAYTPPSARPSRTDLESAAARPAPVVQPPPPPPVPEPPAIKPTPTVAAAPPAVAAPATIAASGAAPGALDGTWRMDLQVTTTYGTTVGGECQTRPSLPLTFVNRSSDGPSGKLQMTADGQLAGWMKVPSLGSSMLPFLVDVSGRSVDGVFSGSVSGRCTGSFVMTRQ
jgi:hypothetical protein